jgi:hypothetical protein
LGVIDRIGWEEGVDAFFAVGFGRGVYDLVEEFDAL